MGFGRRDEIERTATESASSHLAIVRERTHSNNWGDAH
jgi:hypothetical protein